MDQLQHQMNDKAREDAQLARDLSKNRGPTDNAGKPVTSPQFDTFTFVPPGPEDIERYRAGEFYDLIDRMEALPEVQVAKVPEDALAAIASMVIGYVPPVEFVDDDVVGPDVSPLIATEDEPRGDTVVTEASMPGPFPTESKNA